MSALAMLGIDFARMGGDVPAPEPLPAEPEYEEQELYDEPF